MKLKNKKTGEIGYLIVGKGVDHYVVADDNWNACGKYKSLAELSEDWEDYEEPKKYWYIGDRGEIFPEIVENPGHIWHQARKEIGNYFETKEEAEKAVKKLKAWKRLKDKGFKITLVQDGGYVYLQADWGLLLGDFSNVELIFGGEEE